MLYAAPRMYDLLFAEREDDVRWYTAVAGPATEVLELGVGTGRIALPLAELGHHVVGVDNAPAMLDSLGARRDKASAAVRSRLELHLADATTLRLGRRFGRVFFPFNGIAHCMTLESLEALFATVRAHLAPGGIFAFDVWIPEPSILSETPLESGRFVHPQRREPCTMREAFRYDPIAQVLHTTVSVCPVAGGGPREDFTLSQKMFYPAETRLLLGRVGFDLLWCTPRWRAPDPTAAGPDDPCPSDALGSMLAYVCAPSPSVQRAVGTAG